MGQEVRDGYVTKVEVKEGIHSTRAGKRRPVRSTLEGPARPTVGNSFRRFPTGQGWLPYSARKLLPRSGDYEERSYRSGTMNKLEVAVGLEPTKIGFADRSRPCGHRILSVARVRIRF